MIDCPENEMFSIRGVELELDDAQHPWVRAQESVIDAYWERAQVERPWLYNGTVMLHRDFTFEDGVISGVSHRAPYAALQCLLRTQPATVEAFHLFGYAAIVSSDNVMFLVRMAAQTAIAGKVVAPAGSLDEADIIGRKVDVNASIFREAREETGLDLSMAAAENLFYCYRYANYLAVGRRFQFNQPASVLADQVREHIRTGSEDEIEDVVLVHEPGDLDESALLYVHGMVGFHFANPSFAKDLQAF